MQDLSFAAAESMRSNKGCGRPTPDNARVGEDGRSMDQLRRIVYVLDIDHRAKIYHRPPE
jgi:hypothetical protein